jgi:hypothetical protein
VNSLKSSTVATTSDPVGSEPDPIAIGLLGLQQRLEALDRLYNEEIGNLSRELAQLKADYVRLYQTRSALRRGGKSSRHQALRTHVSS